MEDSSLISVSFNIKLDVKIELGTIMHSSNILKCEKYESKLGTVGPGSVKDGTLNFCKLSISMSDSIF